MQREFNSTSGCREQPSTVNAIFRKKYSFNSYRIFALILFDLFPFVYLDRTRFY